MRIQDPLKQWKLSEMDLQAEFDEQYTKAKEEMFDRTSISEAPWYIVEGMIKDENASIVWLIFYRRFHMRNNSDKTELPKRIFNPDYERRTLPNDLYVPKKY